MTEFQAPKDGQGYDRVVSIEMFEHMKNYQALLKKVGCGLWGRVAGCCRRGAA